MGVREDALSLLHDLMAQHKAEEVDRAVGWVVVCHDDLDCSITLHGPFEDPLEALAWAEALERDCNRGRVAGDPNDPPWRATVQPLLPTED